MSEQLEQLYREALSALKAKEYDLASRLLKQILSIDENYKDASRLLAQTVKLRRRRWYSHPVLWTALAMVVIIGLGLFYIPKLQIPPTDQLPTPTLISPTFTSLPTTLPSTATAIATHPPAPTSVPFKWKRISLGQEFPRDKIVNFIIDQEDPDLLYVFMENAGYFRSVDGGGAWQPVQVNDIPRTIMFLFIPRGTGDFVNTGPDGVTRRYRNDGSWNIYDQDKGTWRKFSEAGQYGSNAISFDPDGSVYIFCGFHICKFNPDATKLTILGAPDIGADSLIVVSPFEPSMIYAAGDGLAISHDGGYTWKNINNGLGSQKTVMTAGRGASGILFLESGMCNRGRGRSTMEQPLYRSLDGGSTWEFLDNQGCFLLSDADEKTLYRLATESDYFDPWIWQLTNKGSRWDKILIPSAITSLAVHPTQKGVMYAYDEYGKKNYYISDNYGYIWKKVSNGYIRSCYGSTLQFIGAFRPMAIDPFDGDHVFVVSYGMLYESHDSCETNRPFKLAPKQNINSIAFDTLKPNMLYIGTDGGAYVSFDSGKTWNEINEGLLGVNVVYSVASDLNGNVYAATPYGIFKLEGK
jgi:hypothetical protein